MRPLVHHEIEHPPAVRHLALSQDAPKWRAQHSRLPLCEHLHSSPIADDAVALKAKRVVAIGPNHAAILEAGFTQTAGFAVPAKCLGFVRGGSGHFDPPPRLSDRPLTA
jgi:hypothetical protein